ncbi:hypothetical protein B0T26DRAFT_746373 [Lasiosphaeria miniovina]|uniref:Uncharacterized protein n=1 Tax=Lasiosphaeria miniovina TaxID=1954250 RepID=A0AA40BHS2_9PEZI|nr:uncharacterized protein B0T26DRAFT_746373 [Lasiosphaeria miniovina]KAK0734473.1 hypothetical protein B0T26DRAFT_746373 [Lasiosphaeria miniovina]
MPVTPLLASASGITSDKTMMIAANILVFMKLDGHNNPGAVRAFFAVPQAAAALAPVVTTPPSVVAVAAPTAAAATPVVTPPPPSVVAATAPTATAATPVTGDDLPRAAGGPGGACARCVFLREACRDEEDEGAKGRRKVKREGEGVLAGAGGEGGRGG